MAKWFYTDSVAVQQGPVDEETLLELNREGDLTAKSLVWQDGMEEWAPFGAVVASLFGTSEDGISREVGVCAYSGRVYPIEDLIPYGEALVGLEHKESFVQRMMEHATVDIADATVTHLEYVGFWWRCLSSLLDYLIKMIPSWICMIPYYAVVFGAGSELEAVSGDIGAGFTIAMGIAYGIGVIGITGVSIFYDTWMVGKYQATLGKIVLGAKVVNPDGSKLTYKRAFVRWLAKKPLNGVLVWGPSTIGFALVIGVVVGASENSEKSATIVMAMMTGLFVYVGLIALCSGVYWMAAFDPEKRALHDRVAATRVVKK
tara:strand:+ start:1051 stop:1998 length:948 start_codon:yes stop_codon:yes gene_type:complete